MGKLRIGICDDEQRILKILKTLIEECMEEKREEAEILSFLSGKELMKKAADLDVIFLDIAMPGMDGFDVGKKIRRINPKCKIVMETAYIERVKESFKIGVFRFVTKPFEKEEIREALHAVLDLRIGTEMIEVYRDRNPYQIFQRDISYFRAYNGYVEAFSDHHRYRKDISMKELEKCLDSRLFFQVSREYIVNMLWITDSRNGIVWVADREIRISRRRKKEFERAYVLFDACYG